MEVVKQGGAGQDVQEGDGEGEEWTEGGMEDEGFLGMEAVEQGDKKAAQRDGSQEQPQAQVAGVAVRMAA
ncbi:MULTISPECIES: hypothetical protein [Enterocloster]|uniref:hypothetical protein n=1 Tax=Enterocloster TaxID=2719313 RepID=UPI0023F45BB4|nr:MULTISPECIES: hypothetical protein [Enterocloster]